MTRLWDCFFVSIHFLDFLLGRPPGRCLGCVPSTGKSAWYRSTGSPVFGTICAVRLLYLTVTDRPLRLRSTAPRKVPSTHVISRSGYLWHFVVPRSLRRIRAVGTQLFGSLNLQPHESVRCTIGRHAVGRGFEAVGRGRNAPGRNRIAQAVHQVGAGPDRIGQPRAAASSRRL